MTEPLQVGQFAIVDYEPVDRGPNAGVFHGKGPADDRADLYIVAEGTTPAGEAFTGHIVSAVGHAWSGLDMSLTGALQRVFTEAERNLADWNRKSIAQHRVSMGLACFGRRGTQAVIAQAGPSAVFHASRDGVTLYVPDDENARPVGAGPAAPQLTSITFEPGDRLLLLSTSVLSECDSDRVAEILELPPQQVLPELWRYVQALRHVTVLLVTHPGSAGSRRPAPPAMSEYIIGADTPPPGTGAGPRRDAPRAATNGSDEPVSNSFQPSLFIEDRHEEAVAAARRQLIEIGARARRAASVPAVAADVPPPLQRAVGENVLARLAAERRAQAAMSRAEVAAPALVPPPASLPPGRATAGGSNRTDGAPAADGRRREQRKSFSRSLVRDEAPRPLAAQSSSVPLVDELAEGRRARPAVISAVSDTIADENAATISGGGSLVRVRSKHSGRWKGRGALNRRTIPGPGLPPTWLVIVIGLSVLLAVVGFITVPRLLEQQEGERYASLIDQAQQKMAIAASIQQDPAERRRVLTEAQALLLEARDLPTAGPEAEQHLAEVSGALSIMDAIRTPASIEALGSLEQFGDRPVAITRIEVSPTTAYLLDSASPQVIAINLDGSGSRRVVYSENAEAKQGRPVATAYLDSTDLGAPALLILDADRALWAYSPEPGLRQVPFAVPASVAITDITVYGRDLYILDAQHGAVLRISPADGGFATQPVAVLETPDLAAARRLAVDAEILATDADGTVRRFAGQLSLVLSEAGIDKRLIGPETPQAIGRNGDIAILDAPGDRIVVLRRDGTFDRQYRHPELRALTALTIRDGIGYVFAGGNLRRVTFE